MYVRLNNTDTTEFTSRVEEIIISVILVTSPKELYVVKIDNWFGPKWVAFSHKVLGAFGVACRDLTIPPFVPNRVISETFFVLGETGGGYEERTAVKHLHINQSSDANANRKLSRLLPNAAIFWWSGNTGNNGRGSLMAYLPTPDGHVPWYVGFSEKDTWHVSVTKGITIPELRAYRVIANERYSV